MISFTFRIQPFIHYFLVNCKNVCVYIIFYADPFFKVTVLAVLFYFPTVHQPCLSHSVLCVFVCHVHEPSPLWPWHGNMQSFPCKIVEGLRKCLQLFVVVVAMSRNEDDRKWISFLCETMRKKCKLKSTFTACASCFSLFHRVCMSSMYCVLSLSDLGLHPVFCIVA